MLMLMKAHSATQTDTWLTAINNIETYGYNKSFEIFPKGFLQRNTSLMVLHTARYSSAAITPQIIHHQHHDQYTDIHDSPEHSTKASITIRSVCKICPVSLEEALYYLRHLSK